MGAKGTITFLFVLFCGLGLIPSVEIHGQETQVQSTVQVDGHRAFDASLTTSVGTTRDRLDSKASITFEPILTAHLSDKLDLHYYLELDRPFDPYKNFTMPVTYFLLTQNTGSVLEADTTLRYYLRGNKMHRWKHDGHMLRVAIEGQATRKLANDFSLMARVQVFGQSNRYRQATDGTTLPAYGFQERVALAYSPKPLNFEFHLIVAQSRAGLWKNDYVTALVAEMEFSEKVTAGISHELVSGLIDGTTGKRRALQLFDSRNSRYSAYVEVSL